MIPRGKDIPDILVCNVSSHALYGKLMGMYEKLKDKMNYYPSAQKYHHWWKGGASDHTAQVMALGVSLFKTTSAYEEIKDYTLDDVVLVSFVHDLDKLWRYVELPEPKDKQIFEYRKDLPPYTQGSKVIAECFRYGVELTDQHIEAIDHHHGGYSYDLSSVYSPSTHMTKLSTTLNCADMLSYYMWGSCE